MAKKQEGDCRLWQDNWLDEDDLLCLEFYLSCASMNGALYGTEIAVWDALDGQNGGATIQRDHADVRMQRNCPRAVGHTKAMIPQNWSDMMMIQPFDWLTMKTINTRYWAVLSVHVNSCETSLWKVWGGKDQSMPVAHPHLEGNLNGSSCARTQLEKGQHLSQLIHRW